MLEKKRPDEKPQYSYGEKSLMATSLLLFLFMSYVYVGNISLRRWLFPNARDRLLSTPIGMVLTTTGTTVRKGDSKFEFKPIAAKASLFLNDTLMTGKDSSMTIQLKDGRIFTLGPGSLVKLSFGSGQALTKVVDLEVFQGASHPVKRKIFHPPPPFVPPPPPPPPPLVLSHALPSPGTLLSFSPAEYWAGKKTIPLSFRANRAGVKINVQVFLPVTKSTPRRKISSIWIQPDKRNISVPFVFDAPGAYQWQVSNAAGKVLLKSALQIKRKIALIDVLPTLGTSNRLHGLATTNKFSGFVLHWKPFVANPVYQSPPAPKKPQYVLRLFKPGTNKLFLVKKMHSNTLILNRDNLILGELGFRVSEDAGNGFIAISQRHTFGFKFLPPQLTSPEDQAVLSPEKLAMNGNLIFFTWMKTNFTSRYQFELARDALFKKISTTKTLRDNFVSLQAPSQGTYYWRVRSLAHGMWSVFSQVRLLRVSKSQ